MDKQPLVSVIIPTHNSARYIERCLEALLTSSYSPYEVVVVDDASTDDTAELTGRYDVIRVQLSQQSGPSAARNHFVSKTKGDILFFIDSDVQIYRNSIARVVTDFKKNTNIAAVFGSYDDSPAESNFVSQYKNLFHHFIHQRSSSEAKTFWAGCGAVRREVFEKIGGFDSCRFLKPSIEDIEMGVRMKRLGYRILFDKDLQVKHLKKWKFGSLLRVEILHRAIPWSKLILESSSMNNDLNLKKSHRISAFLVDLTVLFLLISVFSSWFFYWIPLFLIAILILNFRLYWFFFRRRGIMFTFMAFPMHLFYYFYSSISFAVCWCINMLSLKKELQ